LYVVLILLRLVDGIERNRTARLFSK